MANLPKVVVGMSGGVDSSVAAALLSQQGYQVIGVMLRLWSEPGCEDANRCCTPEAMAMARRVSAQLNIPFYVLDAQDIFRKKVVEAFIADYSAGKTPNPCLICNRWVRWAYLLGYAMALDAEYMATGHYARLIRTENGNVELRKGLDINKDQSYVLSVLKQSQLAHTLLPLGDLTKTEVRQLARDMGLPVAERAESQDLCFLGDEDYRNFLIRQNPELDQPGEIVDREGRLLGHHRGVAFYTIGQRKGLRVAAAEPFYVIDKDVSRNRLIVGKHDELGNMGLIASGANWVAGAAPNGSLRGQVKIRYKADFVNATIESLPGDRFKVCFDQVMRDITPGQAAVVYDGDNCLGGGIIESVG